MKESLKRYSFKAMGSFCELQILHSSRIEADAILSQMAAEVHRLENKYSRFNDSSFLSEINRANGNKRGIEIDQETEALFDHALSCYEHSDGLFDVTAGILNTLWNFKEITVPEQSQVDQLLPYIGFHKLSWENSRLFLPANMQLDLGGIVKEYAADSTARLARDLGVKGGLVNLGGDFAVIGPQPGNRSWAVGITSPKDNTPLMARIDMLEGGLASSGDYERFFVHKGKRYSHILNPKTGWPCRGLRAVSVAASLTTIAGSFATIAMLMEERAAKQFLLESSLAHVFMDSQGYIDGTEFMSVSQKNSIVNPARGSLE